MRIIGTPLRGHLTARWLRVRVYLLVGPVFGVLWFGPLLVLYVAALASQFLPLGVGALVGAQLLLRPIGRVERSMIRSLLGEAIAQPRPLRYERSTATRLPALRTLTRRGAAALRDASSWRVLAWALIRFVAGPLGFAAVALEAALAVVLLLAPLAAAVDAATGALSIGPSNRIWLLVAPLGLVLLVPLGHLVEALALLHRWVARWALGPGRPEREAAALARAEAAEAQVRIDQELHDSIGHMLSMIVVQAGAGAYVFDSDPAFARSALQTIEHRGRAALGELDAIIARIRTGTPDPDPGGPTGTPDPDPGGPDPGGLDPGGQAPMPRGGGLPALVSGAAQAGMRITSRIRVGDLPPAVGRGAYRIVQEALTNAAKHAPGSPVTVEVAADRQAVAVSVVNPVRAGAAGAGGPGNDLGPTGRAGSGLASIRRRARLLGGAASAGRSGPEEFAVRAVLPLHGALAAGAALECSLEAGCGCAGCAIRGRVLG